MKREGQFLLPMVELVDRAEMAIDSVTEVMGRATIEAVLDMSAEAVAGPKQAGRAPGSDDVVWYGRQSGQVYLSHRKVRVERPRLKRKGDGEEGEVEVPAYAAMKRPGPMADRMLEIPMAGVSTRKYGAVIPEMASRLGEQVGGEPPEIEASERVLNELTERRLDAWNLLVIYIDGIQFGAHHVLAAVTETRPARSTCSACGSARAKTRRPRVRCWPTSSSVASTPVRRRLFVIDGSKALRCGMGGPGSRRQGMVKAGGL